MNLVRSNLIFDKTGLKKKERKPFRRADFKPMSFKEELDLALKIGEVSEKDISHIKMWDDVCDRLYQHKLVTCNECIVFGTYTDPSLSKCQTRKKLEAQRRSLR